MLACFSAQLIRPFRTPGGTPALEAIAAGAGGGGGGAGAGGGGGRGGGWGGQRADAAARPALRRGAWTRLAARTL